MVLQQGVPARVWGWSTAGASVQAQIAYSGGGSTVSTSATADATGLWIAHWPAQSANLTPATLTFVSSDGSAANITNVLFGDVIFCWGQSNLAGENTPVNYVYNASAELAAANSFPNIRVFQVGTFGKNGPSTPALQLAQGPSIPWSVASSSSVSSLSATCWFTGRDIAAATNKAFPIGLVESAWGGTSIQVWSTPQSNAACNAPPSYPGGWPTGLSSLYNGMVYPFQVGPMPVRGFVWYQGESQAMGNQSMYYSCALPRLVSDAQKGFGSPGAWFGIVQLAPWIASAGQNGEISQLRDVQLSSIISAANATTITAIDGGDPQAPHGSIHPRAKQLVGARLAAAALTTIYGQPTPYAGPTFASATVLTSPGAGQMAVRVTFDSDSLAGGGLVWVPPSEASNSTRCPTDLGVAATDCAGLQIQGSDGVWYNAAAAIDAGGQTVVLTASNVPAGVTPAATSNGWAAWPVVNLYNGAGLPAYPWSASV